MTAQRAGNGAILGVLGIAGMLWLAPHVGGDQAAPATPAPATVSAPAARPTPVDVGEHSGVTQQQIDTMIAHGWHGDPTDGREVLYPPTAAPTAAYDTAEDDDETTDPGLAPNDPERADDQFTDPAGFDPND